VPSGDLSDEIIAAYRKLMNDPKTPPHLMLGAANKLSAHLAAQGGDPDPDERRDVEAPDPMMDLDELEVHRRKRARS
jgi:hypothetical protein